MTITLNKLNKSAHGELSAIRKILVKTCTGVSLAFVMSCGQVQSSTQSSAKNDREKVTVDLYLSAKESNKQNLTSFLHEGSVIGKENQSLSFSLLPATSVTFNISGCKSGYTATNLTESSDSKTISLYKYDRTCVAGLQSFEYGGVTYVPVSGVPLAGAANDTAMYHVTADPTKIYRVKVLTQLDAQLNTSGSTASFVFEQIVKGADYAVSNYTHSHTATAGGLEAPNVTIHDARISDIDVDGKATFEITYACSAAMNQVGADWNCPTATGAEALIKNMAGVLAVNPTLGSTPTLSVADVETTYTTNAAGVVDLVNLGKVAGQSRFTVSVKQQTAGPLYTDRDLVVYLKIKDAVTPTVASYKYFRMTIGAP